MGCIKQLVSVGTITLGLATGSAQGADTAANNDSVERANDAFEIGRGEFMKGNFSVACPKLAESYRLDPATGTLMALAACHDRQGELTLAWGELTEAEERARSEGRNDRLTYIHGEMEKLRSKLFGTSASATAAAPASARPPATTLVQDPMDVRTAAPLQAAAPTTSQVVDRSSTTETQLPATASRGRLSFAGLAFFGGKVELDSGFGAADMETTFGVSAGYDQPLHRNFLLGAELGVSFWNFEDSEADANKLFTLLVKPKARYPMLTSGAQLVELYVTLPIGLNISSADSATVNSGLGFSAGVSGGATYWVSQAVAVYADLGIIHHSPSNDSDFGGSLDSSFSQTGINLGVQIAL